MKMTVLMWLCGTAALLSGVAAYGQPGTTAPAADPAASEGSYDPTMSSSGPSEDAYGEMMEGSGSGYGSGLNPAEKAKRLFRILRLNVIEAESLAETLKQMFPGDIQATAFPKTNTLVVVGTAEQIEEAEKLVTILDQKEEKPQADGQMMQMMNGIDRMSGMYSKPSPADVGKLKQQYAQSDKKSKELAAKYREDAQRLKSDHPRLQETEKQIQRTVAVAFEQRQDMHRAEIAQLEEKLRKMKALIAGRDRIKQEIIDRRVADLKNPLRKWEESEEKPASDPFGNASSSQGGRNQFFGRSNFGTMYMGGYRPRNSIQAEPSLQGTITAVIQEQQLVEVSLGSNDGLQLNTRLQVWRGNRSLGEVEVTYVTEDRSAARIIKSTAPIHRGDQVGTEFPAHIKPDGAAAMSRNPAPLGSVQIHFTKPEDANLSLALGNPDPVQLVVLPGRIDVPQRKMHVFQLENVPGHPKKLFFGTFISPDKTPDAEVFARHNAIPVEFTNEDLNQASQGNLLTKVFYLPKLEGIISAANRRHVEVLVSTKLDPGLDPIQEATKRGEVLGILQLSNWKAELSEKENTPPKFLQDSLENLEAKGKQLQEELRSSEERLRDSSGLNAKSRAELTKQITILKNQLAGHEFLRNLYLKKMPGYSKKEDKSESATTTP